MSSWKKIYIFNCLPKVQKSLIKVIWSNFGTNISFQLCSKNQIKSIRSFQKQILTFNFHDIGHGLKIADEQNVNGHSQICLEQWDNQLFGYLHEIFKWWLKTMTYLWSTPLNLSWISRKPELSKEIGNWWLGTSLGQIWRLQCLARPLEHPWGRGILLQKLAATVLVHISLDTKTIATTYTSECRNCAFYHTLSAKKNGPHQYQQAQVDTIYAVAIAYF